MYLQGFHGATTWQEALNIWLYTDAPTGRYEINVETTQQIQQASVIRYLATWWCSATATLAAVAPLRVRPQSLGPDQMGLLHE
ncbi:hypothetical protein [Lentzea sp. HUAS12]|uniref:hypothetical protein n=1 Tax=Lentzea sp. HUAS12 TaxID=2951806 RepID=UPI0020A20CC2|nr:hypothetical protein [Lentzea sp. HUAS12]USX54101.1 hypothetical protein ND450_08375 [Lentzea sp. HUAS12]